MKRVILFAAVMAWVIGASAAQAGCIVADPSPTPLNVRTAPYGRVLGAVNNGAEVTILDSTIDNRGRVWVFIADGGGPFGWAYREYIVCKGETRR